jgi:hypothetical protein
MARTWLISLMLGSRFSPWLKLVLAAPRFGQAFQERRESVPGGCGENIPVFAAPEKPDQIKSLPIERGDGEKCGLQLISVITLNTRARNGLFHVVS